MADYSPQEERVLRYLEAKYLERQSDPSGHDDGVNKWHIIEACQLVDPKTYYRVIARLKTKNLVSVVAQGSTDECLVVGDSIVEAVQALRLAETEAFAAEFGLPMANQPRFEVQVPQPNPLLQPAYIVWAFIAGPSDVEDERNEAAQAIHDWNAAHAIHKGIVIQPVMQMHARAEAGGHPQDLLNRQLLDRCAILITLFWSRLGSPTQSAPSGTVQEIREFIKKNGGEHAMIFFSKKNLPPDLDHDQHKALLAFKEEMKTQCLYKEFEEDFGQVVRQQLDLTMNKLLDTHVISPPPVPAITLTAKQAIVQEFRRLAGEFQKKWGMYENGNNEALARRYLTTFSTCIGTACTDAVPLFLRDEVMKTMNKMGEQAASNAPSFKPGYFWLKGIELLQEFLDLVDQIETF